jgi:MarR family transcriptional regulator, lower aerobic nicotinate degradation pathway regulator
MRYQLERQVGFVLRKTVQRHLVIFTRLMGEDLTPTQFAAMAKLYESGPCSQNRLGRLTAMDAATIKGVTDRLGKRGLIRVEPHATDARLQVVHLTGAGRKLVRAAIPRAVRITDDTLKPLTREERSQLLRLLQKLS